MAHINFQGTPTRGRIGGVSYYYEVMKGLIARIATSMTSKGHKSSEKQRMTQLALANLVILWRLFDQMLNPSFRTRKKGWTEPNAFASINWEMARVYLTKDMVKNGACVVPPVKINVGTLEPSVNYWKDSAENWVVSSILLGDLVIDEQTTVGEFSQAVCACNGTEFPEDRSYIDFFRVYQSIDINTNYPRVAIIGRHLELNSESTEPLWQATGGREGFESYKGHLATTYAERYMFAWIRMVRTDRDEYRGTTQSLLGDNTALLQQFTSEQAFDAACKSYGGFNEKFLIPFKAKLNPFHYTLKTQETQPGVNPDEGPLVGDSTGSGNPGNGGSNEGEDGDNGDNEGGDQGGSGDNGGQTPSTVEITVACTPAGGGTPNGSGSYTPGSEAQISITPSLNWNFIQWDDGDTSNPRTIIVPNTPTTYTATMQLNV